MSRPMSGILDLLAHIFGEQRGFVGLFSGLRDPVLGNNLDAIRSAYLRWSGEHLAICEWLRDEDRRGREAYFCAHLLTGARRTKANAADMSSCYVDADGAKVPLGVPTPTAVVESSPGREHFYWRLTRPVTPEVGEQFNRRLALAMGGDPSGWDLTQLLRPPGTHNHKYECTPLVVLREMRDEVYDPEELDRLLPPALTEKLTEVQKARRPEGVRPSPDLSRLSRRMQDLIRYGNHGEYKCRSRADMAACIAMFGAGYSAVEVWATMSDPTNGISEKFLEKGRDGERYLALTIGKAQAWTEVSTLRRPKTSKARRLRRSVTCG